MDFATVGSITLWGAVGAAALSLIPGRLSVRFLWAMVALTSVATVVLTAALVVGDFSMAYVVKTTSLATPWPYRVSALWGGMEGSLLFYTALVAGIGAYGIRNHGRTERSVIAVAVLGLLLLTALGSNPFQVVDPPPVDGDGLLAILQHPAMVYHPPILYLGLTTLIVPFALTVGWVVSVRRIGSLSGSAEWLTKTRRWLTWSWTWLAVGMVAGANWAYVELGWGGYWAWDPVENTALMPFLATTVFLHTSRLFASDGRLLRTTVFFALFPFALSVLGIYLTRSGVTGSIHAFAEDPVIGQILLIAALVVTALVAVLVAFVGRGRDWGKPGPGRDTWLAASAVLVALALVFILVGSAYPAFLKVFWDSTVVVGPRFFVTTILPVALVIAGAIGFALHTTWTKTNISRGDVVVFVVVALAAGATAVFLAIEMVIGGVLLLGLAAGAVALLVKDLVSRRHLQRVAVLAHLGMALVLLGSGGSALGSEFSGTMHEGDRVTVGPHTIDLVEVSLGEADRYVYAEGLFVVDGRTELRPQIRGYEAQRLPVAEPALKSTPMVDIIVAVTLLHPELDRFEVSVFVRPMVWWVWVGALVLGLSGVVALFGRGGASARRHRAAREEQQQAGTTTDTTS